MCYSSLISIIIPAYNREHLIGETLDSILAQTYENWECIITDDGSTDNTLAVLEEYHVKDKRILYGQRAVHLTKGANTCRNIGLKKAKGDYIVFFDSDDLMTPNHLEVKNEALEKYSKDYIITKTAYFNADNAKINKNYPVTNNDITASNYITKKVNWLTYDVIIKADLAKSIKFNENLKSGQEYNYFCKLVLRSVNASFINEVVTLRRSHEDSIRANLKIREELREARFYSLWYTYLDIENIASGESKKFLMRNCIDSIYIVKKQLANKPILFLKKVFEVYKLKGFYFILMLLALKIDRAYFFRNKLMNA